MLSRPKQRRSGSGGGCKRRPIRFCLFLSATSAGKTGEGIEDLLNKVITDIPAPTGNEDDPLRALIFDSEYDPYRGIITSVRIVDGKVRVGDIIEMMETHATYEVLGISIDTPKEKKVNELSAGDVGYIYASIKSLDDILVGDTIT